VFLYASVLNYPGGEALSRLHSDLEATPLRAAHIHIGVKGAMTGISRFGQRLLSGDQRESGPYFTYSKEEDVDWSVRQPFTHVISENATLWKASIRVRTRTLFTQEGFAGLRLKNPLQTTPEPTHWLFRFYPVRFLRSTELYVLEYSWSGTQDGEAAASVVTSNDGDEL
jgi:hypothetical protein